LTLDGLARLKEHLVDAVEPVQDGLFSLRAQVSGPACFVCGIPVVVSHILVDVVTRTKRWRRRGIGREPKIKVKVMGRKPMFYEIGRAIITNPEGLRLMQKEIVDGRP
jgi:hypothetical protein